ncbi:hypothetical protein [Bacillus sp. FJAT-29814]|nr:hypothetical protein [Bacillus sp. FJAT-29814]
MKLSSMRGIGNSFEEKPDEIVANKIYCKQLLTKSSWKASSTNL